MASQVQPPVRPLQHRRRSMVMGGRYTKREGMPQAQLFQDVYPSIPERIYGLEKDVSIVQREFREHREETIRQTAAYATREHVSDLESGLTRMLAEINQRLDKRTAWIVLQTVVLLASLAYSLLLSYKHFITH